MSCRFGPGRARPARITRGHLPHPGPATGPIRGRPASTATHRPVPDGRPEPIVHRDLGLRPDPRRRPAPRRRAPPIPDFTVSHKFCVVLERPRRAGARRARPWSRHHALARLCVEPLEVRLAAVEPDVFPFSYGATR